MLTGRWGAYFYNLALENGFELKGRITHHEDDGAFKKAGYYWVGQGFNARRSLYTGDTLYNISNSKINANLLTDLTEFKELVFSG